MYNKFTMTIRNLLGPKHYFALLVSLLSLTVLAPLVDHDVWTHVVVSIFLFFSLLTATMAINKSRRLTFISFFLVAIAGVMWVTSFACNIAPFNTPNFQIASFGVTLLFFMAVGSVMWKDIFSGAATANRICGAVCLYLLIGFCFAMVHLMVALENPRAYKDNVVTDKWPLIQNTFSGHAHYPLFVYFSFCTLSTAGYGDIVPVTRLSRSISWVEAITGQLYLAILVARLVGMHIVNKSDSKTKSSVMAGFR